MRPSAAGLCARGDDVRGLAHAAAPRPARPASRLDLDRGPGRCRCCGRSPFDAAAACVAENSTVWRCRGRRRRGSPRCPRRTPCRASRRPRRAPPSATSSRCEGAAAEVVEGPARGGDDDVDAALERAQLPADRLAAVDRQHPGAERRGRSGAAPPTPASPARGWARGPARSAACRRGCGRAPARCSIGRANAAVLPVPVAAWPSRSRPASSGGIASRWIGVGSS